MNNEAKILTLLERMDGRLGNVENHLEKVDGRLDSMDNRLGGVESHLENVDSRLDSMDLRMDNMSSGQNILTQQIYTLTEDVKEIRHSQVRMENELTEKVRALFDDRSVNQDHFKTIKNTLARIENNLQTQSFMIIDLKGKQENQEAELRLLRSEKQS